MKNDEGDRRTWTGQAPAMKHWHFQCDECDKNFDSMASGKPTGWKCPYCSEGILEVTPI